MRGEVAQSIYVRQGGNSNATLDDFEAKVVIGKGSFGKVILV